MLIVVVRVDVGFERIWGYIDEDVDDEEDDDGDEDIPPNVCSKVSKWVSEWVGGYIVLLNNNTIK